MGDARFDKDNKDVFQPFSVGPRNCIGQKLVARILEFSMISMLTQFRFAYDSMKLILSRMVWRFNLKLEEASKKKPDWLTGQLAFVSFHQPPLNVELEVRSQ